MMGRCEEVKQKRRILASNISYNIRDIIDVMCDISETLALIYDTMTGEEEYPEEGEDLP